MRALRDVDLHRPATRRRRRVELPNPTVHIPSAAHQCRAPTTHRTNTCLQSHQRNHHYRDCLYNIINFGLFEDATCSEPNPNSMGRGAFSSQSRYHLPKKRTTVSYQNPTLQTPSSPKNSKPSPSGLATGNCSPGQTLKEKRKKNMALGRI